MTYRRVLEFDHSLVLVSEEFHPSNSRYLLKRLLQKTLLRPWRQAFDTNGSAACFRIATKTSLGANPSQSAMSN